MLFPDSQSLPLLFSNKSCRKVTDYLVIFLDLMCKASRYKRMLVTDIYKMVFRAESPPPSGVWDRAPAEIELEHFYLKIWHLHGGNDFNDFTENQLKKFHDV